jgi:hypothetical protein
VCQRAVLCSPLMLHPSNVSLPPTEYNHMLSLGVVAPVETTTALVLEGAAVKGRVRQEVRWIEALLHVQIAHRTHL